ncbi:MAG TPA: Asp-tRNA(Asn)/Glu-tRNA(Gln) amidotransferase subunit GatB [Anaerolineae bacterium]|nr:Asp-tRNA(Asn)/Glu-tRNA(Gln) amidotransferase subunit GatB [Anaerolineae bacterium]
MNYEGVIGLEVHAELVTQSKMFCGCAVVMSDGEPPNSHVCPICTGMPGMLPVINRRAVEMTIMTGLALNCTIEEFNIFARKNYFYPDLPKGYQISQYDYPLCRNGWLEIETSQGKREIRIRRVHLEEDTGKNIHQGDVSLIDFNRSGVPLMEIVSEPDLHTAEEVKAYGEKLRAILRYLGVNTGDMEKGVIRFEPNISIRPIGATEFGTRTELKNLNSFRALERGTAYELGRQAKVLNEGGKVTQETRGWDEQRGVTVPQRSKEQAEDYRYFPEPDLPPLIVERAWVEEIRAQLPELADVKYDRFEKEYGLSAEDVSVLVADRAVATYFEATLKQAGGKNPKAVCNWLTGELFRYLNEAQISIEQVKVTPAQLAELIGLVDAGTINLNTGKRVLGEMFKSGQSAKAIVEVQGLAQINDMSAIEAIVTKVLDANSAEVEKYLGGKETVLGFLVGQVMKESRGKANPATVQEIMRRQLAERKK